jgi:hypothetical protein
VRAAQRGAMFRARSVRPASVLEIAEGVPRDFGRLTRLPPMMTKLRRAHLRHHGRDLRIPNKLGTLSLHSASAGESSHRSGFDLFANLLTWFFQ